jgi:hypothetical protein
MRLLQNILNVILSPSLFVILNPSLLVILNEVKNLKSLRINSVKDFEGLRINFAKDLDFLISPSEGKILHFVQNDRRGLLQRSLNKMI